MKHGARQRDVQQGVSLDTARFAKFLWGDVFYDIETRKFARKSKGGETPRSFVHFILEPIYKVFTKTLTGEADQIMGLLKVEFGVDIRHMKKKEFEIDINPLLNLVIRRAFPKSCAILASVMSTAFVAAAQGTSKLVRENFGTVGGSDETSKLESELA